MLETPRRRAEAGGEGDQRTHGAMSEQVRDPSKAAKARQRGLTVLERLLAEETAAAEKEEARRLSRPRRALSVPRAQQGADKDANGGEGERGRGRQRINESGQRADGADVMQLQRRSRSLMSKKNWRRSVVVNSIGPAGGAIISGCPERSDARFEQGTAAGTAAHAAAVREWIRSNLSDAGSELRTIDQKDRNVMLFNDWLEQSGYEPFADWVKDEAGWKPVVRCVGELLEPAVPTAESLIEYAFKLATGDRQKCPKGGRPEYRNGEW